VESRRYRGAGASEEDRGRCHHRGRERDACGGFERVGDPGSGDGFTIEVPAGRWTATVHLLNWRDEPGSVGEDGRSTADALPDFVIVLVPDRGGPYRSERETFEARELYQMWELPDPATP
jgi:hypothetical protein